MSVWDKVPDHLSDLRAFKPPGECKVYTREEIDEYIKNKIENGENPFPDPKKIKKRRKKPSTKK